MREGREPARGRDTRHVLPSLAGAPAGKAPACGRLAALRGACLGLAGRGNGRHSRPQAAFSCAPPRAKRGEGGACAASARGGLNCGPPQGQGLQQQPAAGAPARLGGRYPQRGAPGRYAGRRVRRQSRAARPAPQAWPGWQGWPERRRPGRRGGRPHSPHLWGPGRPGAPAPRPARGRSNARPGLRPAPQGLGLALRRGAPAQRLAANLTRTRRRRGLGRHFSPARPCRGLDGAGGGTAAAQGGQGVGPQAGGAGGTWPARRRDADGSPYPQAARPPERTKKGVPTGHSLLFLAR